MGYATQLSRSVSTIVYVGLARLPQPFSATVPSIAAELEVDLSSRIITSVTTNLEFPGLARMLTELLVGQNVDVGQRSALLELEVRYSAPFAAAVVVAVQGALRRAANDADDGPLEAPRLPSVNGKVDLRQLAEQDLQLDAGLIDTPTRQTIAREET